MRAGQLRLRRIDSLQSAKSQDFTVGLALDYPKCVAKVPIIAFQPFDRRVEFFTALHAAQPAHHIAGIEMFDERLDVADPPTAQNQPFGFQHDVGGFFSHAANALHRQQNS